MQEIISSCGRRCSSCRKYAVRCAGCTATKGEVKTFAFLSMTHCPIYQCCHDCKKYHDCSECDLFPCEIYHSCREPIYDDREFLEELEHRKQNLTRRDKS